MYGSNVIALTVVVFVSVLTIVIWNIFTGKTNRTGGEKMAQKLKQEDDALVDSVRALLRQGRKNDAIQMVRHKTGVPLKIAKDFVDQLNKQEG